MERTQNGNANAENVKTHKHAKLQFYFTSLVTENKYVTFTWLHGMATTLNSNKHSKQCELRM